MLFNKRENLWDYTLEKIISEGDILEFGTENLLIICQKN